LLSYERHAETTVLVSSNLDFNSLVRLPGISCRVEGLSGYSQNDSRPGIGPKGLRALYSDRKRSEVPLQPEAWARFATLGIGVLLATSILCLVVYGRHRDSDVPVSQSTGEPKTGTGLHQQININRASVAELKTLPGVGEATAKRIVAYRSKNPPFRRVEELLIIRGISRNRLEQIRNRIRLD